LIFLLVALHPVTQSASNHTDNHHSTDPLCQTYDEEEKPPTISFGDAQLTC